MFDLEFASTTQRLPYDLSSIMHFQHNAFGYPHQSTLEPVNHTIPKKQLGISVTGTDLDFLHINLLYCEGNVLFLDKMDT